MKDLWSQREQLHETLPRDVLLDGGDNACTTFRSHRPLKIWECKNGQNLVRLTTTFDFERKYL